MRRRIVLVVCVLLAGAGLFQLLGPTPPQKANYSKLLDALAEGRIRKVDLDARVNSVAVYSEGGRGDEADYETGYPNNTEPTLVASLREKRVSIAVRDLSTSPFAAIGSFLIPVIILVLLWVFIMSQAGGGQMRGISQLTQNRARRIDPEDISVGFHDVAGIDEVLEEVRETVDFLQDPERYAALGARVPRGILLSGPPGSGKTLIARSLAAEAGVPFWETSGSEFLEVFVGVASSRIRSMFAEARKAGTGVIFIDELDAIGRQRGAGVGGGNDERENALNQLLVEMDGFAGRENVIVVAATNRPDVLDPALLRPGRFDRQIVVDLPDKGGRERILRVHARSKPLGESVDLAAVAAGTTGLSGADLENLLNEASIHTARRDGTTVEQPDIDAALLRIVAGPEKRGRLLPERERRITAYHELGHALVGHVLEHTDPIERVSIVARGRALGFTLSLPSEDRFLVSRSKLKDEMAMTLGGRAAEALFFDDVTTGASGDLERVTEVAKRMVMRWAMSDDLGQRVFGHDHSNPFLGKEFSNESDYSERIADRIDHEIRVLVDEAYSRAHDVLVDHRDRLEEMALALLEHETFTRDEFEALFDGRPFPDRPDPGVFGHERVGEPATSTTSGAVRYDPSRDRGRNLTDEELAEFRLLVGERGRVVLRRDGAVSERDGATIGEVAWADRLLADDRIETRRLSSDEWLVWVGERDTRDADADGV